MRLCKLTVAVLIAELLLLSGCESPEVSFKYAVHPILKAYCERCHSPGSEGFAASGFSVESYDTLMKGTRFGPVIEPGASISSTLVILAAGKAHESINMPRGQAPLSHDQINLIKRWIDEGAKNN